MNKFKISSTLMLGLIFTFFSCDEDDTVTLEENCPELAFTQEGSELTANFKGIETLEFYAWQIKGESLKETIIEDEGTQSQGDNKFKLNNLETGTYTVCLISESSTCAQAEPFCKEIVIKDKANSDCPDLKFSRDGDYLYADFPGIETLEFYAWQIKGESLQEEIWENEGLVNQGDNKFDLTKLQVGTYTICLQSEGENCGSAEPFCKEIVIENDQEQDQGQGQE